MGCILLCELPTTESKSFFLKDTTLDDKLQLNSMNLRGLNGMSVEE